MRALLLLALLAGAAGCLRQTEFRCATSADCTGTGGVCEVTGYCSFADGDCAMGQRYGDYAGTYSNKCVGDVPMIDGGVDSTDGPTVDGGACPGTYAALPNIATHVYRVVPTAGSWTTQRDLCATEGGYLAIPANVNELQALITASAAPRTWVGISDIMVEGTYRTVNGDITNYLPWDTANGEPDNAGGQDCVSALMASPLIRTDQCSDSLPAICECVP